MISIIFPNEPILDPIETVGKDILWIVSYRRIEGSEFRYAPTSAFKLKNDGGYMFATNGPLNFLELQPRFGLVPNAFSAFSPQSYIEMSEYVPMGHKHRVNQKETLSCRRIK